MRTKSGTAAPAEDLTCDVDSPAWRGMQERLGIVERVANGGRAWRRCTCGCLGLLALSLGIHAYAFTRPMEKFHVVEIDTCRGESRVVGPIPDTLTFRQVAVHYILKQFVMDLRGISTDIESTKAQWRRLRQQVTPEDGAQLLNQTEAEYQPLTQQGAVLVKVIRFSHRDGNRYDVRWQETRYGTRGEWAGVSQWGGLFTFRWETPKLEAPLGMMFDNWQVAKES